MARGLLAAGLVGAALVSAGVYVAGKRSTGFQTGIGVASGVCRRTVGKGVSCGFGYSQKKWTCTVTVRNTGDVRGRFRMFVGSSDSSMLQPDDPWKYRHGSSSVMDRTLAAGESVTLSFTGSTRNRTFPTLANDYEGIFLLVQRYKNGAWEPFGIAYVGRVDQGNCGSYEGPKNGWPTWAEPRHPNISIRSC